MASITCEAVGFVLGSRLPPMLTLALSLALAATPDEAWARDDDPPPRPRVASASGNRMKRFLGTLAGGAVGFGLPLALLPLADQPCISAPVFRGGCPSAAHGLIAGSTIVLSLIGALIGHTLVNDEASFGAGVAGTFVGIALGLGLLAAVQIAAVREGGAPFIGPLVAAGALVVTSQALALTWRSEALDEDSSRAVDGLRVALETGTFVLASALGVGLTLFSTIASSASRCWQSNTCALFPLLVGGAAGGLVPLATWGVHRAKGGRGTLLSAYLATAITGATAFLAGLLTAVPLGVPPPIPTADSGRAALATASAAIVGGTLLAVFAVPLGLEVSHQLELGGTKGAVSLGAVPLSGGAMGVVGARF